MSWVQLYWARDKTIPMKNDVQNIEPRPLTRREVGWKREILQTSEVWKDTDIGGTEVIAEGPCDEGISIILRGPEPANTRSSAAEDYIGRLVICTDDNSMIEVRLTQADRRLHELFVLFVDPKHPRRKFPESWTEVSHEASEL